MIELAGVRQRYADRTVLAVESLTLAAGERLAIVGPNGSGKSTLLRIMACLEAPAAGDVRVAGRPVTSEAARRAARARVTLVEQQPFLFRGTVLANVAWGLTDAGREAAARAALDRLHAGDLAPRDVRALSVGEIQRVAVARALARQPDALLLDEPASGADRAAQHALDAALASARADRPGLALAVVSHQLETAWHHADRVLALHDGAPSPVTPENLFRVHLPGPGPMQTVLIGGVPLDVIAERAGPATLAIPPEEVVLSRAPLQSSARNALNGRITALAEQAGAVRVTIDAGIPLVALVTRRSFDELGLAIGQSVVASFKSVAVRVF